MDRLQFLQSIVDWLRAGYPQGVPHGDYIPLVALLRRQLTEDEVQQVARELTRQAPTDEPISKIDAGVEIFKVTEELPSEQDIARVQTHLEEAGWPFDDRPLEVDDLTEQLRADDLFSPDLPTPDLPAPDSPASRLPPAEPGADDEDRP